MNLPTKSKCVALMKKYGAEENILRHSEQVRRVANTIAQSLAAKGHRINLEAVDRAALLHDIAKLYCIKNNCRHAAEGRKILAKEGYPELGDIVKLHGLEEVMDFNDSTSLEAKIVWYADKRVNHDSVVSMRERYDYLKEHYGSMEKGKMAEIIFTEKPARDLEKWLVQAAGLDNDFLFGWG